MSEIEQKNQNQVIINTQQTKTDSIQYQDGSIQNKVYGSQGVMRSLIIHLIQNKLQKVDTIIVNAQLDLTVAQLATLIQQKSKIALNNSQVKSKIDGSKIQSSQKLQKILPQKIPQQKTELYIFYNQTKAIFKQVQAQIKYETLSKYSFLDDKSKVKVYIDLPGVGKLPSENITSRFLQWSIEIKIHDLNGKNYIFAVPKTQCIVRPSTSKVIQKQNKIIIAIGKNSQSDNWFSIYKTRMVGQRDD